MLFRSFPDARNSCVLVIDTRNSHGSDGTAFKASNQNTTERIAERGGLPPIQGPNHEHTGLGTVNGNLMVDPIDLVLQHGL